MPEPLAHNNSFKTVKLGSGAIGDDSLPLLATIPNTDRFDADSATDIVAYWGATTPTGVVTVESWAFDHLHPTGPKWIKVDSVAGIAFDELFTIKCYGGSNMFLTFAVTGGATGSDAFIRAARTSAPH